MTSLSEGLHIDFETRSTCDLRKTGPWVYGQHYSTDVHCAAYALGEAEIKLWRPGMPRPEELTYALSRGLPFIAHNSGFERSIFANIMGHRYGWPIPPLDQWYCTASFAAAMSLPRSLDKCAEVMGVDQRKDKKGHELMLRMARPRSKTKVRCVACGMMSCDCHEMFKTQLVWWSDEERLQRLFAYCIQDVAVERELTKVLRPLSERERRIWLLDQKMNERGVAVDMKFARQAAAMVKEVTADLNTELAQQTGEFVKSTNQAQRLKVWMACNGVPVETLRKNVVAELLTRDLGAEMRAVVELRQEGAKSSTAKFNALLNRTCIDDRIRDNLMYHAASTGRWGGKGFQPQNLMRLVKEFTPYLPRAIEMIRDGCGRIAFCAALKVWEAEYNGSRKPGEPYLPFRPLDIIACCLRPCLVGDKNLELILADFSSVEARGVAWLFDAENLLGVFRRDEDPYLYQACIIYRVEQGSLNKDDHPDERQLGKRVVLGCGYQMGWPKFQTTCQNELPPIYLTDDEAKNAVTAYREGNPEIPAGWKDLERGAFQAISDASQPIVSCANGKIKFAKRGTWLYMQLPSGRVLHYADPKLVQREMPWLDERTGVQAKKWCVSFMGVDSVTHSWRRQYGYGGLWTENAVQALCRDLLAEGMLDLEAAGYPLVLSVHDEGVSEIPVGFGSVKDYEAIMTRARDWAPGFPNKAEGQRGWRYKIKGSTEPLLLAA
jgi:DNA polymerase